MLESLRNQALPQNRRKHWQFQLHAGNGKAETENSRVLLALGSTPIQLLPEHAVFFPASRTLVVADLHLGKAFALRENGLPVEHANSSDVLEKLAQLIARTAPERLVIAGDFLHAPANRPKPVVTAIARFLERHRLPILLTGGNHDIGGGAPLPEWNFNIMASHELEGIVIVHNPADAPSDRASLCGHKHPAVLVRDGKNTKLSFPCFWLSADQLILPAFGSNLGMHHVPPAADERYFIAVNGQVVELPDVLRATTSKS